MKTLFQINVVANSGSHGRIAEELGRLAIASGWKSYIAYGRWACPSQSTLIRIGTKFDVWFHGFKSILLDRHGFGSRRATIKLIEIIKKIKPDIIHLHNLHGYYLNCEVLFNYLSTANIPVVWTLHDCWSFTGHCVHFQDIGCEKWKTGCFHCPIRHDYPRNFGCDNSRLNYKQKKKLFSSVESLVLVPVCKWLDNLLAKSYLSQIKRRIITNGIDLEVFKPSENLCQAAKQLACKSQFIVLAVASNWNPTKGFPDILYFAQQMPETLFVMIGLTKKQIKKLPKNIIGYERTENISQLVDFYTIANILINPTYQDTFPTVNIEAMACGTPVITYNTGGCEETISHNTGFVVPRGDKTQFLTFINQIKLVPKTVFRDNCIKHVANLYSNKDRYKEYFDLYCNLLNDNL